jgi:hypothetical protein
VLYIFRVSAVVWSPAFQRILRLEIRGLSIHHFHDLSYLFRAILSADDTFRSFSNPQHAAHFGNTLGSVYRLFRCGMHDVCCGLPDEQDTVSKSHQEN